MSQLTKAQEEYFKDSVIRNDDGSLKVVYHGSFTTFDTFDKDFIGRVNGTSCGKGFNFTESKEYAESFAKGDNAMLLEAYIDIKKPLRCDKFILTTDNINGIIDSFIDKCQDYSNDEFTDEDIEKLKDDIFDYYNENKDTVWASDAALLHKISDSFFNFVYHTDHYNEYEGGFTEKHFDEYVESYNEEYDDYDYDFKTAIEAEISNYAQDYVYEVLGFDGIIGDSFVGCEVYICFEPNQIKSINNLYPTQDDNFINNEDDYFKNSSLEDKLSAAEERAALQNKEIENKSKEDLFL